MFNFSFDPVNLKKKLAGFVVRFFACTELYEIYVKFRKFPKESLSYSNLNELTPEQRYVLELEKAGKLRQVAKGMWEYTKQ